MKKRKSRDNIPKRYANKQRQLYRYLVATALLAGNFQLVPVLADGTTAGQSISNTATATYEDADGTKINATSNTVVVTVAEVAGITVTASGVTDVNGGQVAVGDTIYYNYTVTNVGNDPTKFRIPNLAAVTGPGTVNGNLEVSYDGGITWTPISGGEVITNSILPGGSLMVRVPIQVTTGANSGDIISVKLGDTPGDAQNQLRNSNGGDVYTVDNPNGTGGTEVDGEPVNGVREASFTQQIQVGNTAQTKPLATILKTRSGYSNSGTLNNLTDDVLTYGLSLRVESTDPTLSGITPGPLVGTTLNVNSSTTTPYILVSDAIPFGTTLTGTPTAPTGWQVVYTIDVNTPANAAAWTTSQPASGVTRVGFINNPSVVNSVAPGATVTGFSFQVVTSGVTGTTTIANIAQLFGKSPTDPPNSPPVYDESGDQNPSNFNPTDKTFTPFNPATDDGYINDVNDLNNVGTDSSNNNSSSGPGGEANVFPLQAPVDISVLSGPNGVPDAVGPNNDNNQDFTNKSALVPAGTAPGSTIDPAGVGFTNTVQNTGVAPANISLLPTPPATPTDLPIDTLVTLTYGSLSATYKYDGANFVFQTGTGTVDGNPISATNPIRIDGVAPGAKPNFGVEVNLPPGTPLSTDIERGFPVPITAFIDDGTPGLQGTEPKNTTIDRVYTGFLKLVKKSRVLKGTGSDVGQGQDDFESTPGFDPDGNGPLPSVDPNPAVPDVPRKPAPGNILEYQISYTNISTPQTGTGNGILNAGSVLITEDGTTGGNNWALDNDANGQSDTSNIVGSAADSGAATITFFSGKPATTSATDQTGTTVVTDVTKYIDTVTDTVAPGQSRTFRFQRKVN